MAIYKIAVDTSDTIDDTPIWVAAQPCNLDDPNEVDAPCFCGPVVGDITLTLDASPYAGGTSPTFTLTKIPVDANPLVNEWKWEGVWPSDSVCDDAISAIQLTCYSDENVTSLSVEIRFGGTAITVLIEQTSCDETGYIGRSTASVTLSACIGGTEHDVVIEAELTGVGAGTPQVHTMAIDTGDETAGVPIWLAANCVPDDLSPIEYIEFLCCDGTVLLPRIGYAIVTGTKRNGNPFTHYITLECIADEPGGLGWVYASNSIETDCYCYSVAFFVACSNDGVTFINAGIGFTGKNEFGVCDPQLYSLGGGPDTVVDDCTPAMEYDFGEVVMDEPPFTELPMCMPENTVTMRFVFGDGRQIALDPLGPLHPVSGSAGSEFRQMYRLAVNTGDTIGGVPIWMAEYDPCCDGGAGSGSVAVTPITIECCEATVPSIVYITFQGALHSGGTVSLTYVPETYSWYGVTTICGEICYVSTGPCGPPNPSIWKIHFSKTPGPRHVADVIDNESNPLGCGPNGYSIEMPYTPEQIPCDPVFQFGGMLGWGSCVNWLGCQFTLGSYIITELPP